MIDIAKFYHVYSVFPLIVSLSLSPLPEYGMADVITQVGCDGTA